MPELDELASLTKCREQCLVGEDVDQPWRPARCPANGSQGALRKYRLATITGNPQAMLQVQGNFFLAQPGQLLRKGNPLQQLPHGRVAQLLIQFRLPEQNDLDQFSFSVSRLDTRRKASSVSSGIAWASSMHSTTRLLLRA